MGVGFCVLWAVGLHICVGASLDTIALPAVYTNSLFLLQPAVKEIVPQTKRSEEGVVTWFL